MSGSGIAMGAGIFGLLARRSLAGMALEMKSISAHELVSDPSSQSFRVVTVNNKFVAVVPLGL